MRRAALDQIGHEKNLSAQPHLLKQGGQKLSTGADKGLARGVFSGPWRFADQKKSSALGAINGTMTA